MQVAFLFDILHFAPFLHLMREHLSAINNCIENNYDNNFKKKQNSFKLK